MPKKPNEWRTLSSISIYQNPWMHVQEDDVLDAHGHKKTFGIVTMLDGSCVLPIDNEGYVYLAKQFRYGADAWSIECPGGSIDAGESPLHKPQNESFLKNLVLKLLSGQCLAPSNP